MTITAGSGWGGSYSRLSYDETKSYVALLKEKGKAVLDDEFNFLQDALLTQIRRSLHDAVGDGTSNNGFLITGTGANNDFFINGGDGTMDGTGSYLVSGLRCMLPTGLAYSSQPIAGPALTTPGGNRTDTVYIDCWLDEVGPASDATMVDPTLATETSRRLKLKWQVLVAENATVAPANYIDGTGLPHYVTAIAYLFRTATAAINSGMVFDLRRQYISSMPVGMLVPFAGGTIPSKFLLCNGAAVSRSSYFALFSAIGTTWGVGDGSTTFNLPDYRRRTIVGAGGTGSGTLGNAVGNVGGEEAHTMTIGELVNHNHGFPTYMAQWIAGSSLGSSGANGFGSTVNSTDYTGGGAPFNVMQPSAVSNILIRYQS